MNCLWRFDICFITNIGHTNLPSWCCLCQSSTYHDSLILVLSLSKPDIRMLLFQPKKWQKKGMKGRKKGNWTPVQNSTPSFPFKSISFSSTLKYHLCSLSSLCNTASQYCSLRLAFSIFTDTIKGGVWLKCRPLSSGPWEAVVAVTLGLPVPNAGILLSSGVFVSEDGNKRHFASLGLFGFSACRSYQSLFIGQVNNLIGFCLHCTDRLPFHAESSRGCVSSSLNSVASMGQLTSFVPPTFPGGQLMDVDPWWRPEFCLRKHSTHNKDS